MSRSSVPFSMPWCHIQLKSTALRSLAPAAGVYGAPAFGSPPRPRPCARGGRPRAALPSGRSLLRTGCRCHTDREDNGRDPGPTIPSRSIHESSPSFNAFGSFGEHAPFGGTRSRASVIIRTAPAVVIVKPETVSLALSLRLDDLSEGVNLPLDGVPFFRGRHSWQQLRQRGAIGGLHRDLFLCGNVWRHAPAFPIRA